MKKLFLLFLFPVILLSFINASQPDTLYYKTIGDSLHPAVYRNMITLGDSLVVTGHHDYDHFIITKLDSFLDTISIIPFDHDSSQNIYDIEQSDNGFLLFANRYFSGQSRPLIISVDNNFDSLWCYTHDSLYLTVKDGVITESHDIYVSGDGNFPGGLKAFVMILDSMGDSIALKEFDCIDQIYDMESLGNRVFAAGYYNFPFESVDMVLMELDSMGDTLWIKRYGGSSWDHCEGMHITEDSIIYLIGKTSSFSAQDNDMYIVKTDLNGNMLWDSFYGDSLFESGYDIIVDSAGNFTTAGISSSRNTCGTYDQWILQADSTGTVEWQQYISSNDSFGISCRYINDFGDGYVFGGQYDNYLTNVSRLLEKPGVFTLISPCDSHINSSSPEFLWNSPKNTVYKYYLYMDSMLSDSSSDTTLILSNIAEGFHSYYITAENIHHMSSFSADTFSFEIDTTLPNAPFLYYPPDNESFSDSMISFVWSNVGKSPVYYNLEIDDDSLFSPADISIFLVEDSTAMMLSNNSKYYWRVSALDSAGNEGSFSETRSLIIGEISAVGNRNKNQSVITMHINDSYCISRSFNGVKNISISLYNINGSLVKKIYDGNIMNLNLNITNVVSGLYFIQMKTDRDIINDKIIILE